MAKPKSHFFCTSCGYETPKWLGQCPVCKEWNTLKEEIVHSGTKKKSTESYHRKESAPKKLMDIVVGDTPRHVTKDNELNRVLGSGIVPGSLILIGGQPGIGKSTLLIQIALNLPLKVLYASGEESEEQIRLRADRIASINQECYVVANTDIESILKQGDELGTQLLIIDSIQTMSLKYLDNSAGSITQIKECTAQLQHYAKEKGIPVFIIGHITKEGSIAGPKLLEHIVDVVLQFEGDQNYSYRLLRTTKNRYGSTDELGIYAMQSDGLRQVSNPSELLITQKEESLPGIAIAATLEGQRPLMIEVQGLVSSSVYGTPQRSATGFDLRRMSMILAVIEKRGGIPIGINDIFLNIAGGMKSSDPAVDLAVVVAFLSSYHETTVAENICFAGEIGLSGEVRAVSQIDRRIQEADRMGFEVIYVSKYNTISLDKKKLNLDLRTISKIDDLIHELF